MYAGNQTGKNYLTQAIIAAVRHSYNAPYKNQTAYSPYRYELAVISGYRSMHNVNDSLLGFFRILNPCQNDFRFMYAQPLVCIRTI